ncbi:nucleotidyltransferase family protein [Lentimicrobium sp. S6]|uniref:nucleotidyltransferase family protein n=1 Tax=Lentimicrobium sp. S6 TaxID=2735872 RepID=UPI001556F38A|nr:nucleotidyltransferase family protein [Lentimicrobium sp. S6]NPD46741.1 CBS domain-containing protein [Lentimicrobium sp. S6]
MSLQIDRIKNVSIRPDTSILSALKQMDQFGFKLLMIVDENAFKGLVSVGDIQRAIIKNTTLDAEVYSVIRKDYKVGSPQDTFEEIKRIVFEYRMVFYPIVDGKQHIVDIYFWEDLFGDKEIKPIEQFDLPVVVMAGGFGSRLKPITNVLPKPLIPIGENSIIEDIFERFYAHGCKDYYISVNYKAELIEYYLNSQKKPYNLSFFKEDKPMGTAGSLHLLKNKIKETFFVSNCDILIDQDYSEILEYHRSHHNELTIVAALKHYPIPYGTIETAEDGQLVELTEKPEFTFKINSGMYILEPSLLNEIPKDEFFHITHLIDKIIERGGKVGVFPVSEGAWRDIGEWDEYLKLIR